jgi:YesN/AraC family two-component response regulator
VARGLDEPVCRGLISRFRASFCSKQQPDFKVVAEANDGREAVDLVTKVHLKTAALDIAWRN